MKINIKNGILIYHCILIIIFVYIFVQFLSMKRNNIVYGFYTNYIMNKYCIILYLFFVLLIMKYDKFTAILLLIMIISPFKCAIKEFFQDNSNSNSNSNTSNNTPSNTNYDDTNIMLPIYRPTEPILVNPTLPSVVNNTDDRFKMDDVEIDKILKQIKSQIDFDPYNTNLAKDVIYEIYNKYFDNDIFVKLKKVNDDSKQYIAEGNFKYVPEINKVDYDLVTYQNLSNNTQIGINPISDGISNNTKINRGS